MTPLKHYFTKGFDEHCFPCVCEVVYLGKAEEEGRILIRCVEDDITLIVEDNPQEYYENEFELARQCADYIKDWEKECGGKANCQLRRTHPYLFT